jgi:hypothetical protein
MLESGFLHHTKLELVGLPGLSTGTSNKKRALVCRPLVFLAAPLSASATLYVISVDTTGSIMCLALVRISHDAFSMDQVLTVVNPELIAVRAEWKGQRFEMPLIRCDSGTETLLLVDGVPVQQD